MTDTPDTTHTPDDQGSADPIRRKPRDRPLLIVNTGHGKGKSSAAFGMLLRSWARGYRCGVFQFVKSGKWKVGEAKAAAALGGIDWEKMGDGWSWISRDLDESADKARVGWERVKELIAQERYEFLLLDELTYPIKYGWIEEDDVVATLRDRPGFQHVVVTGRDAPRALIDAADLVSEVVKVKHPMDAGIRAQQGIEW
ncbi:MAG TPA: cob(I)yrinic acid a,c-diamide adenosyltransferase [Baekduia sp.]|uniref:cob(I)yrinic acid a,c-diamide adenosyltransferase n=1 Tax=Baekduia sp. TaxID=2600305 RepID=UPI002D781633|nr:cob(I)yrinic acid a,c-diamide adenosyltransferase [Baekduia sp.]HET6505660.1 cob(I)yrinic acid a,c-diamide adenosyltransferase [Baekduia sp.]